jgi:D-Tyr-tRNAtyr deacylase
MYEEFVAQMQKDLGKKSTNRSFADMKVALNDGPVTIIIDSKIENKMNLKPNST